MPRVVVMLACNDYRNGHFAGEVDAVEVGSRSGDFHLSLDGPVARVTEGRDDRGEWLRVGRHKYRYRGSREWYGNWCWNAYGFSAREAARLLNNLRARGWRCDEGFSEWFDKFNDGAEQFTAGDFARCSPG